MRDYTRDEAPHRNRDLQPRRRPSGHVVREGFTHNRGGAIPPNLLVISNTGNDSDYVNSQGSRSQAASGSLRP